MGVVPQPPSQGHQMSPPAWGHGPAEPRGSSSYLGIKVDRDHFGLRVPPDEGLGEVVLGFLGDRLGPV